MARSRTGMIGVAALVVNACSEEAGSARLRCAVVPRAAVGAIVASIAGAALFTSVAVISRAACLVGNAGPVAAVGTAFADGIQEACAAGAAVFRTGVRRDPAIDGVTTRLAGAAAAVIAVTAASVDALPCFAEWLTGCRRALIWRWAVSEHSVRRTGLRAGGVEPGGDGYATNQTA